MAPTYPNRYPTLSEIEQELSSPTRRERDPWWLRLIRWLKSQRPMRKCEYIDLCLELEAARRRELNLQKKLAKSLENSKDADQRIIAATKEHKQAMDRLRHKRQGAERKSRRLGKELSAMLDENKLLRDKTDKQQATLDRLSRTLDEYYQKDAADQIARALDKP